MANNSNDNKLYYEFPKELMPMLKDLNKLYEIIKRNLTEVDMRWLSVKGRHSLIVDLKLDLIYLISFISVMGGSPDEFPLYLAEGIFANDPPSNYAIGFIRAAENMKIKNLISNYTITEEDTRHFDEFTSNVTNILRLLPACGSLYELSMIYYLYGSLIASICKILETNAASPIVLTGINNYLKTQFDVIQKHLTPKDHEEFKNNVFPYLQHVNDRASEIENALKEELAKTENNEE